MGYSFGQFDYGQHPIPLPSLNKEFDDPTTIIQENIPILIWTATPDGEITYFNSQWNEYLGPGLISLELDSLNGVIHPDDIKNAIQSWPTIIANKKTYELEFRLKRFRDKKYIWFLGRAIPIRDVLGQISSWLGFCIDINELKEAKFDLEKTKQELIEATQAKSQFLANMSHEIRTPLGVIIGFADLALDAEEAHADAHDYLKAIKRNSQKLTHIIQEVLDLSKADVGKLDIIQKKVSLTKLIDEVVTASQELATKKGLKFSFKPGNNFPDYVETDPMRLEQILTNLISNAINFTNEGEVKLSAKMISPQIDGQIVRLEFSVSDTGVGIPESDQGNIFKPFKDVSNSMVKPTSGRTGMGLILAHQMAQAMGGDLWLASSHPRKGSTFTFTIQAGEWEKPMLITDSLIMKKSLSLDPLKRLEGKKILLVEDSPDNQILINHYLMGTGVNLTIADNGFEGVEKSSHDDFDVIIMDIQMPVMDGYQATKCIRQNGFNKPIIALTAHALRQEQERALNSGFNIFLTKPISKNVLIESLARAV